MLGTGELLVFGGLALLFFGAKKLPELGTAFGQFISGVKKGAEEGTMPKA